MSPNTTVTQTVPSVCVDRMGYHSVYDLNNYTSIKIQSLYFHYIDLSQIRLETSYVNLVTFYFYVRLVICNTDI